MPRKQAPAAQPETPEVQSIQELLDGVELAEVRTYLLHAERGTYEADDAARIAVAVNHEGTILEVRCKLTASTGDSELAVDRSAVFTLQRPLSIPSTVMGEFVERVGVMTIYPYLREAVFTVASSLGVAPPVMGLLRAGSIKLTPDPDGSATAER
ncbi:MAG TPA: hypothetical protein VIL68_15080 [Propionibacteriaceae bacterium]